MVYADGLNAIPMCGDFKIGLRIPGHAIPPIHDAVVASVNRGLEHGVRNIALQRINKIAGATPGVAGRQYATAVLLQDTQADGFGRVENGPTSYRASNGEASVITEATSGAFAVPLREQSPRRDYDQSGEFSVPSPPALFLWSRSDNAGSGGSGSLR